MSQATSVIKSASTSPLLPNIQPRKTENAGAGAAGRPQPPKKEKRKPAPGADLDDETWRCIRCDCPGSLTPVKRLGPDGQRNLCNACYIRGRAQRDRGLKGSARPMVSPNQTFLTTGAISPTQQYAASAALASYYGNAAVAGNIYAGLTNGYYTAPQYAAAVGAQEAQPAGALYYDPNTQQMYDSSLYAQPVAANNWIYAYPTPAGYMDATVGGANGNEAFAAAYAAAQEQLQQQQQQDVQVPTGITIIAASPPSSTTSQHISGEVSTIDGYGNGGTSPKRRKSDITDNLAHGVAPPQNRRRRPNQEDGGISTKKGQPLDVAQEGQSLESAVNSVSATGRKRAGFGM